MKKNRIGMNEVIADYVSISVLLYLVEQGMSFDDAFYNAFSNSIETELWDDVDAEEDVLRYVEQDDHGMYVVSDQAVMRELKSQVVYILRGFCNENIIINLIGNGLFEKLKESHGDLYKFLQSKLPEQEDS